MDPGKLSVSEVVPPMQRTYAPSSLSFHTTIPTVPSLGNHEGCVRSIVRTGGGRLRCAISHEAW